MSEDVAQWLEQNADRSIARQRAQSDAMKLVATFMVGIVASLVSVRFDVSPTLSAQPDWALKNIWLILFGASVVAAVFVILLDRMREPDPGYLLSQSAVAGWTPEELLEQLRLYILAAARNNEGVLSDIRVALGIQVALALLAGVMTIVSILGV